MEEQQLHVPGEGKKGGTLRETVLLGSWLEKQQKSNNKEATLGCEVRPCQRSPPRTARGKQAGQGAQQRSPCCHLNHSRNDLPLKLEQKTHDLNIYPTSSPSPSRVPFARELQGTAKLDQFLYTPSLGPRPFLVSLPGLGDFRLPALGPGHHDTSLVSESCFPHL